jgi:hypothetical protein
MKSTLIALLLVLLSKQVAAQSVQTIAPFKSAQVDEPAPILPNLNLKDWNKGWASPSSGGTINFDYTKLFEWLLPKKHPKIPPECDPKFFLRDSIPPPPAIKVDSINVTRPPV